MQNTKLNFIPNGVSEKIYASQYDVGRAFSFNLYDGSSIYTIPSGASITINGLKADGKAFIYNMDDKIAEGSSENVVSFSGSTITIKTTQQMTAVDGDVECQIRISESGHDIGILNFIMNVQINPAADGDISETDIPSIIAIATEQMERAEAAADSASADALDSEAWAKGTRGGSPVGSSDPAYHNNAKHYAEDAGQSATTASGAKEDAEDAMERAEAAADKAEEAYLHPPYIGANGNWWVYDLTQEQYIDSGVDASITVQIADITMLDPDANPYVTNTGTNTDPIFHLFIPRGKGISNIAKTATSGLVDTYTITYSDGATYSFNVTNGKTAYQSAVEGGYTGTEAEFEDELAHFKDWYDGAEEEADRAQEEADRAQTQANRAQAYADYVIPEFVIENNRLYMKAHTTSEFIVANNRLYVKAA